MIYSRILLKLSGEALMGNNSFGLDPKMLNYIAEEIKSIHSEVGIGVVIGGGNIFRGLAGAAKGMDRVSADYMGMLATVINSLALQDALERIDVPTRVQTSIEMRQVAEPFIRRRAIRHLNKGRVVIFGAGTGNPYFTTDTTATLRASEISADIVIKATSVDGVYDSDPKKCSTAVKYEEITYLDILNQRLNVMDSTAISMCMDNNLPLIIYNINKKGALREIISGIKVGTLVK